MKKWIVGLVVLLVIAGGAIGWWGCRSYLPDKKEAEAQRLYEEHKEVKNSEGYRAGYESEEVIQRLEKALEADPTRTDIRMELFSIYDNRRGHIADNSDRMKEMIAEGLKAEVPAKEKVKLMRVAASYYPSILGADSPEEARNKIIEEYPYTDYGVEVRLGKTSSKAKRTTEDALSYLEKTREIVKKHAEMNDKDPERKLMYLDYLKGVYWKQKGEYEKAADIFVRLYDKGGVWKVNKSDLKNTALPVLEKVKRWEDIKHIVENFYETKSSFDFSDFENWSERSKELFLRTTDGQLWKEAKEKLGE